MSAQLASVADLGIARLVHLDQAVDAAEGEGLRARWEFGRDLLAHRTGKKLPKGLLDDVAERTAKSRQEIGARMKFAERFPGEDELSNAVRKFGSWHAIVNEALSAQRNLIPVSDEPPFLPEGTFRVIVADPPWQYGNKATRGAAEDHYSTMTTEELCGDLAEQVQAQSADDAHLYLWVTNGFLREGFDVLAAWGFTYKTCLTWVKPQMGMGNYFRSSTEHILFGVRGKLAIQDRGLTNWFEAPRGKHSAKPDSFYDLVEKASAGPYLEMFARRRRLNWSTWGNEA